jgi:hypothetical protein
MSEYHKIQTVFLRDPDTKFKTLLQGQWALPEFEYLAGNQWRFTEKVNGTNIRIMVHPQHHDIRFEFGGKTDNASIPAFLVNRLEQIFRPKDSLLKEMFPDGACLYGEGYGAKIQKGGGNYKPTQDFVLFDVRVGDWWLQYENVLDVAQKLELDFVPISGTGTLHDLIALVREGFTSNWGNFPAEGIVARPLIELKARSGHRIITKLKTQDFQK